MLQYDNTIITNLSSSMLNIIVKTVPDTSQRYDTVGDYYIDENGKRVFSISSMEDWRYEFLILIHELVESTLCKERDISGDVIDAFDFAFENARKPEDKKSEPGNDPSAPYFKEHQFASKIERMIADELGVDWHIYETACERLTRN